MKLNSTRFSTHCRTCLPCTKVYQFTALHYLYHNLQNCQLNQLQQIQKSLARAVVNVNAPKSTHITPIVKSLHWLKVNEHIEYKLLSLSLTKFLQPLNLAIFTTFSLQPPRSAHFSSAVTLSRPPTISSLKITDRSIRYASPRLWNQLPDSFRQPHQSCLDSSTCQPISIITPLLSPITPSLFHFRLKTYLFNKSFPP